MSPIDAAIVRRKLGHIVSCLEHLRPMSRLHQDEFAHPGRFLEKKAAERLLQEAIEAALDVNAHVIAELGQEFPEDYYGGFLMLARMGLIPEALALELAPSAGLRNRLVHEYDEIDDAKIHASIQTILHLYPQFVNAVEGFIEQHGL